MLQMLICRSCGRQLSRPVNLLEEDAPKAPTPTIEDQVPPFAEGIALIVREEPIRTVIVGDPHPLSVTPQAWMNPNDLLKTVRNSNLASRLNGCCGLDGCDGPNQLCVCGAEIGTRLSDCWTMNVFVPLQEATEWTTNGLEQ
ncbi:hypothetical protein QH494_19725 [Sphingomonas sp. AR_OL41]|uniref:hypothetical protein n=1 Tax=Sphingomonas sp. AR_OL41 TaxID=3042729 RepID=UPI0024809A1B|nr:hypothetical protein [Sphingomonas sp. AR_OL41]MDH7974425.1 hypothetical protein [Sphingomonas sp. AR_OL41]